MTSPRAASLALLVLLALSSAACTAGRSMIPMAPPTATVRPDVARGFAAYEHRLEPWGTWSPDADAGVHWCPSAAVLGAEGTQFRPYLSRGQWGVSEAPIGRAPAGSLVWKSDDAETWGEITTHHGWWVRVSSEGGAWCWVPGAEATPARVEWREGDGFVGWAPEPPDDADTLTDDLAFDSGYDWVFSLLGMLLDRRPADNTLSGDAARVARSATGPARSRGGAIVHRPVGPSSSVITAAHTALVDFAASHPAAMAAALASSSSSAASASDPSKASSSSSSSDTSSTKKSGFTVTFTALPPPYAMAYYDALLLQPAYAPVGLVPRLHATDGAPSTSALQPVHVAAATAGGSYANDDHASRVQVGHAATGSPMAAPVHTYSYSASSSHGSSSAHSSSSSSSRSSSSSSWSSSSSHSSGRR